jgi:hypothetical protein
MLEAFKHLWLKIVGPISLLKTQPDESKESFSAKDFLYGSDAYCYRFDDHGKNRPMKFDLLFRIAGDEYRYQFSLLHAEIVEENLYQRNLSTDETRIVFERAMQDCYIGDPLGKIRVDDINATMPLLSYLAISHDIEMINKVKEWFYDCIVLDYNRPSFEEKTRFIFDYRAILLKMFAEIDINITDIRIIKDDNDNVREAFMVHRMEDGTARELPFDMESSGTRKLFSLLQLILVGLAAGAPVFADEMDAKLHPKLLRYIIELFTDPRINKHGAQLIFTSHDMCNMNRDVFRRDEIWFTVMGKSNASKLYSLVDFRKENGAKPRSDESYDKQYIEGRYGADPYIRKILDWEALL